LQFKKIGSGHGFFNKMLSGATSSPLFAKGQIALRTNPASALVIAEQMLNSDPNTPARTGSSSERPSFGSAANRG